MTIIEAANGIHYPRCRRRCKGDTHSLANGDVLHVATPLVDVSDKFDDGWAHYERQAPR